MGILHKEHNKLLKVFLLLGVPIVVIAGFWLFRGELFQATQTNVSPEEKTRQVLLEAKNIAASGDKAEAARKLQAYADGIGDDKQKAAAYMTQAAYLQGEQQVQAMMKSYTLNPSSAAAGTIAEYAFALGNRALAKEYYQKAIDTKDENSYDEVIDYYRQQVKEMSQ